MLEPVLPMLALLLDVFRNLGSERMVTMAGVFGRSAKYTCVFRCSFVFLFQLIVQDYKAMVRGVYT